MRINYCELFVASLLLLLICGPLAEFTFAQQPDSPCKKEPEAAKPPIIIAAKNCDIPAVNDFIAGGAQIETKDEDGNTLLKYAIEAKCEKLIDLLLTAGADANARSIYERTPFLAAAETGPISLVKRLIALGADAQAKDKFGATALFYADDAAMTKILVEAGADVNAKDYDGFTALMHAVMGCDEDRIVYLVDHGANVNARNEIGITPLGFAACGPRPRILKSLISAGADINARDNEGQTPLMLTMGYPDTTELFIKAGAKVNLTDKNGKTALDHAMKIETFREEIITILKKAGAVSGKALPNRTLDRRRRLRAPSAGRY